MGVKQVWSDMETLKKKWNFRKKKKPSKSNEKCNRKIPSIKLDQINGGLSVIEEKIDELEGLGSDNDKIVIWKCEKYI